MEIKTPLILRARHTDLSVLPAGLNLIHVKTDIHLAVLSDHQNYPQTLSLPVIVSLIIFIERKVQYIGRVAPFAPIERKWCGL